MDHRRSSANRRNPAAEVVRSPFQPNSGLMRSGHPGGELVENQPGQGDWEMSLKLGDFMWQEANAIRALHNAGTTPIELIEFELK
jgi:hypothetical protein